MADSEAHPTELEAEADENDRHCERGGGPSASEAPDSCEVDEPSLDSLKNTPTNIARLEDVIESFQGRQKYLAQTKSPSDGGDVCWYCCKVPLRDNELAASIPHTEFMGKGDYFRFGRRDSLAIEASFLQREEEFLSCWWREYAECSEGPKERRGSNAKSISQGKTASPEGDRPDKSYVEEERIGVPVKGGLYEVDLVKRHCFPVYWDGENHRVLRGHWFARKGNLDWLPLREDVAEQLEFAYRSQVWHRRRFQPSGLFAARVDLQGFNPGLHALFTGEDDNWEAWLNVDTFGFSSVVGFGGNASQLRRGYSTSQSVKSTKDELRQQKEEMDDYYSQVTVQHLVFMVHGIGQRLEKSNLIDDVGNVRRITGQLAESHLSSYQRQAQRVLFIPCQWRRGLKLSGETAVEKITLEGVRGLRSMLSATVHDVLYYMSPIYCQDIINSVSDQLNMLYLKFLKRNPGYDGKVSIYGHSLGSVLSYDILCHQENLSSPFPMEWMFKEHIEKKESFSNVTNEASQFQSVMDLEEKNYSLSDEYKGKVDLTGDDKMSAHVTPLVQKEECASLVEGETRAMDAEEQDHGSSMNEEVHELLCDSKSMICQQGDDAKAGIQKNSILPMSKDAGVLISDSSDMHCEHQYGIHEAMDHMCRVPIDTVEKVTAEVVEEIDDKDKAIKLLSEQVSSLKARVEELETQCAAENKTSEKEPFAESHPPVHDDPKSYRPYIKYTKLEFKVDTFFAVGSPLGVFLALRNVRIGLGRGEEYWEEKINEEMPACQKMFNIFHPFDPVAYRLEPLICKDYLGKRPVIIPYHKGGKRLHIGFQDFTEDIAARSQSIIERLNSIKVRPVLQSGIVESLEDATENVQQREEKSYGSLMMERLTGSEDGRVDHMLQDKTFQHAYISAVGAHTNYWRDYDTALFILKHLYREIPVEPNSTGEYSGGNSTNTSGWSGWSDQKDDADEELPLTFSDNVLVKSFSEKAMRFLKK